MIEVEKISIKRPAHIVTNMCITGIHDSVRHNVRILEILDENGSFYGSKKLRIEKLEELLNEIYMNEMLIVNELNNLNGD